MSIAEKVHNKYSDDTYACIRCLARQEQGACDKYARADKYYMMSEMNLYTKQKQKTSMVAKVGRRGERDKLGVGD